jgi:hypothetical protein
MRPPTKLYNRSKRWSDNSVAALMMDGLAAEEVVPKTVITDPNHL